MTYSHTVILLQSPVDENYNPPPEVEYDRHWNENNEK
jgi:hypothetical protein